MAEIHVIPGVERRDLMAGPEIDGKRILECAIEAGVVDVVVIGRARDGSRYVATSIGDVDRSVGVLMGAVTYLSSISLENDVVIDTDESSPA